MAGPRCTVCDHAKRDEIDRALVADRASERAIAGQYKLAKSSVHRHAEAHLPQRLAKAAEKREDAVASDLVDRLHRITERVESLIESAEEDGDRRIMLDALKELARHLELEGKVFRVIADTQINITARIEWQTAHAVIIAALRPHPEALADVARALEEAGVG